MHDDFFMHIILLQILFFKNSANMGFVKETLMRFSAKLLLLQKLMALDQIRRGFVQIESTCEKIYEEV